MTTSSLPATLSSVPVSLPNPRSHHQDLDALHHVGLDARLLERALAVAPRDAPGRRLARVLEVHRDRLLVHDGRATESAVPWPALRARLQVEHDSLVVGDWVWTERAEPRPGDTAPPARWVSARVPPLRRFARRDPAGGSQPLVANVDIALLVMGLDRDFNLARLDRYLVLAQSAGAAIVVVLTKADRHADPDDAVMRVRRHMADAWPVVAVDARTPQAAQALAPWTRAGTTLALLGSSGAGKSTLTGTLLEAVEGTGPRTGATRAGDDRGRHTTTTRTLHLLPSGACLVDTPGLRQLALDVGVEDVGEAFGDIAALAPRCRFRDCAHEGEPGCAVRDGVPPERLRSFRKLLREAQRDTPKDPVERKREVAAWKAIGKAGRARAEDKRRVR